MKIRISPNGLHLFDRGTGLNVLLDELQPDRTLWSSAPRQVSIALTNVCDLHCQYCYAPKHKASLNSDQILQWAKELDVAGCFSLGLGGGEPTLHPEFVDICQKVARNTDLAVTFTTHGQRITPQLVAELKGSVHFIRISTDGVGETYERLRGRPYRDLLKGIELAARIAPFGINVVVNDQTVSELSDISAMAESMGARELLLLPQQPTQHVSGLDHGVIIELQQWVSAYSGNVQLAVSEVGASGLPTCEPLPDEIGIQAYAHIDATGVVRASSYATAGVSIGDSGIMAALTKLTKLMTYEEETTS